MIDYSQSIPPTPVPSTIRIITVYSRRADDGGPSGDYRSVEVWFDFQLVATYGDEYHDKGKDKASAFVQGAATAWEIAFGIRGPEPYPVDRWPTEKEGSA